MPPTARRARPAVCVRAVSVGLGLALAWLGGCTRSADPDRGTDADASSTTADATTATTAAPAARAVPAELHACRDCHAGVIDAFLGHAMSDSLGPIGAGAAHTVPDGELPHAAADVRYVFGHDGAGPTLTALRADGGVRVQRIVGRLGAGLYDTAFVGTELDPLGRPTDRLAFLPVERLTQRGASLAPFAITHPHTGFDQPVTAACLECHTTERLALPGAPGVSPSARHVWPSSLLGAGRLSSLRPLGCEACHGALDEHAAVMATRETPAADEPAGPRDPDRHGVARLRDLPAAAQRDICARCHLEGAAHLELAPIGFGPQPDDFLARRPTLVPAAPGDDFRFVSQLERLALSRCSTESPDLTCTSCHEPHRGVAAQGAESFDARCLACHRDRGEAATAERSDAPGRRAPSGRAPHLRTACARPPALRVEDVTGAAARTAAGCIDCHVRRSQPFDLPHLRTADHFVRRRIPPPAAVPMRHFDDPAGELVVFDDGRLAAALATPAGARWQQGLSALGLLKMGRAREAAERLAVLGEPGSQAARTPSAPPGLPPLETSADVHHLRGAALAAAGRTDAAIAACGDALVLDPEHPEARLERAALLLERGDLDAALHDAQVLVELYPHADKPWNVRARAAALAGDRAAAAAALARSTALWPSDPATWHELGRLLIDLGEFDAARAALEQARRLQPSRAGLADDVRRAGG